HSPRRMLVDLGRGQVPEIQCLPALRHGSSEFDRLTRGHAAQHHRHEKRAHLVVRDIPFYETVDERLDRGSRQLLAITLGAYDRLGDHGCSPVSTDAVMRSARARDSRTKSLTP